MRERPIIFSAPMVRAILDGRKTVTRRVVKPQPSSALLADFAEIRAMRGSNRTDAQMLSDCLSCPYGAPGDRLVVREAWRYADWTEDGEPWIQYRADDSKRLCLHTPVEWADRLMDTWAALSVGKAIGEPAADSKWCPSIHMPRWASRITLEITGVRVERLQDISEADAEAEGVRNSLHLQGGRFARDNFAHLWWTINGDGSWEANPFVWCVSFRKLAT